MNYDDALDWLFNIRRFGPKRSLEPTRHVLSLLGNPHLCFSSIHIGGTNGKGSTSALTASILQASGYKVGLYTSPHLEDFRERIKINDSYISEEDTVRLVLELKTHFDEMLAYPEPMPLRFFDVVTAVCFKYFKEQDVDYAVIEVGLGGRLDATNTLNPLVSVITNIGYEHVNILGPTLLDIAAEKGGIIKPDTPLVTAETNEDVLNVFKKIAHHNNAPMIHVPHEYTWEKLHVSPGGQTFNLSSSKHSYPNLSIPLFGTHQIINAATSVAATNVLNDDKVDSDAIRRGLKAVYWPGRLEVVSWDPLVVLDCAKDAEATEVIRETLDSDFTYDRVIAVVSMSSDKNIPGMIENIAQVAEHFIVTQHTVHGRAARPEVIIREIEKNGKSFEVHRTPSVAIRSALNQLGDDDMVLVIGSVYLAGDVRVVLPSLIGS